MPPSACGGGCSDDRLHGPNRTRSQALPGPTPSRSGFACRWPASALWAATFLAVIAPRSASSQRPAYPPSEARPVTERLHVETITDPYRWLEDQESADTRAWIDAQNRFREEVTADVPGIEPVPNLRGGGEFGEEWHRVGVFENKQNVCDDFFAAAEWLIDEGYTSPDRLAIAGGSNGGLLAGAAMTQRPELYRAVVCSVPLLDMLRYHQFLVGRYWVSEYGSADDPEQFEYLRAYSPYHNVREGVEYPAVLFETLSSLLFGVTPSDPLVYGAVALVLLGTALAANYVPARKASKISPMTSLTAE